MALLLCANPAYTSCQVHDPHLYHDALIDSVLENGISLLVEDNVLHCILLLLCHTDINCRMS